MRVKTEAKRDAILAAAAEVFLEAGFEGASMAEIAKRIGGSKATLYGYFKSKEELFVSVMHDEASKYFDPVFAALSKDIDDLPKALQAFGEKLMEFVCSDTTIQTLRAVIAESGRTDIGQRFHEMGPRSGAEQIAALLERQIEAGLLRKADPMLMSNQLKALLDCELVTPLLYGIGAKPSKLQIRQAVRRALKTFFAAYAIDPALGD